MNNFSGHFNQPPAGVFSIPIGASAPVKTPPGPLSKANLKEVLKRLVAVSQDMESTGRSMSLSRNMAMLAQMQDKMDKLAKEQAELMKKIVDTAQNTALKNEFLRLTQKIGKIQAQIKNSNSQQELDSMQKAENENVINTWVDIFRDLTMDAIKSSKE